MSEASRARMPVHPYLFALFPVCHLYFSNIEKVPAFAFLRPACVLLVFVAVLLLVLRFITKESVKAAVICSILILAFYVCWGALMRDLVYTLGEAIGIHARYVFAAYALVIASIAAWAWRSKSTLEGINRFAAIVAGILIILSPMSALRAMLQPASNAAHSREFPSLIPDGVFTTPAEQLPDVYFIVLDGYARADVLRQTYGFDNRRFLEAMKARGFFVADRAHQNYWTTMHSLPACLNMDYLENFGPQAEAYDHQGLSTLYHDNPVHRLFRQLGYDLVGAETGWLPTEPGDEFSTIIRVETIGLTPSHFESYLFEFTPFPRILRYVGIDFAQSAWYNRLVYVLEHLYAPATQRKDRPVYVQAHIISPHDPFVFDPDGSRSKPLLAFSLDAKDGIYPTFDKVKNLYVRQIQGLNTHVERAIDQILNTAKRSPIIALVSDHGPGATGGPAERLSSLLMLRLPGVSPLELSHDMNLVELFPIIFDKGLGVKIPMPEEPAQ